MSKHAVIVVVILLCWWGCNGCDSSGKPRSEAAKSKSRDVTIVYRVESGPELQVVSFKMRDGRARNDTEGGAISTIHDPDIGVIYLDHAARQYLVKTMESPDVHGASEEMRKIITAAAQMRFTGKRQMIGEWECEEFVLFDSRGLDVPPGLGFRAVAWIARDFDEGKAIQSRKDRLAPVELYRFLAAVTSKDFTLPGFAVRTETQQGAEPPSTSTCVELRFEDHDPDDFTYTKGYSAYQQ